jgi:transposase
MHEHTFHPRSFEALVSTFDVEAELFVAIDVAKRKQVACLASLDGAFDYRRAATFTFEQSETRQVMEVLGATERLHTIVVEPSGAYTDIIVEQARRQDLAIAMVNPKKTHDSMELLDGVPNMHDRKSAKVLAWLHRAGLSRGVEAWTDHRRRVRAVEAQLEPLDTRQRALFGRLEAVLARHWPGITDVTNVRTLSLLTLLETFGCPEAVVAAADQAFKLVRKVSNKQLSEAHVAAVIDHAHHHQGVAALVEEAELIASIAADLIEVHHRKKVIEKSLRALLDEDETTETIVDVVGTAAAATLLSRLGPAADYDSAQAYQKAAGLSMRFKQSGEFEGRFSICRRGPAQVRKMLYLVAMRMVRKGGCPYARRWYLRYVERNGGLRKKALVGLMRKLMRGLWHVGRGADYDGSKLFDVRPRLEAA